jgi:hypothetical protein
LQQALAAGRQIVRHHGPLHGQPIEIDHIYIGFHARGDHAAVV